MMLGMMLTDTVGCITSSYLMITEDDWGMTATAGLNLHLSDNRTHLRPVCPLSLYPNVRLYGHTFELTHLINWPES